MGVQTTFGKIVPLSSLRRKYTTRVLTDLKIQALQPQTTLLDHGKMEMDNDLNILNQTPPNPTQIPS